MWNIISVYVYRNYNFQRLLEWLRLTQVLNTQHPLAHSPRHQTCAIVLYVYANGERSVIANRITRIMLSHQPWHSAWMLINQFNPLPVWWSLTQQHPVISYPILYNDYNDLSSDKCKQKCYLCVVTRDQIFATR